MKSKEYKKALKTLKEFYISSSILKEGKINLEVSKEGHWFVTQTCCVDGKTFDMYVTDDAKVVDALINYYCIQEEKEKVR